MISAYKLIAVLLAYGALTDALTRWRVRPPERRLQLQLYGAVTLFYCLVAIAAGSSSPGSAAFPSSFESLVPQFVRGFFGSFGILFILLGALEVGLSAALQNPSYPFVCRWWFRALTEGPVWSLLCRRRIGTPLAPDEADSCLRHVMSGAITIAGAVWALQVAAGTLEWTHLDPVPILILIKALNVWLDGRLWNRDPSADLLINGRVSYPAPG